MGKCNTILTIPEPGRFRLEELPVGEISIRVTANGYETLEEAVVLASPPPGQLTLDEFLVGGVASLRGAGTGEVLAPLPTTVNGGPMPRRWRFG